MHDTVIVGSGGTLGAFLRRRLKARGIEPWYRSSDGEGAPSFEALADAPVVVNVGGPRVRPGLGWNDYLRCHLDVVRQVVRWMRPGSHLIHVSSTAVFGRRGDHVSVATPEAPELFPTASYAWAKLTAELAAKALGAERGLRVTVLRPSMVYGPGVDSALSTLAKLSRRGVRLQLEPQSLRQHLVHMDLLVRVVESLASTGPKSQGTFLVADPFVLTNADLSPKATGAEGSPRGVTIPVHLNAIRAGQAMLVERARALTPLSVDALAVLALDNTFEVSDTFAQLGIDPNEFGRARTFDPYWENPL